MRVRIVVINKGEAGESCEVYEHYGDKIKIEVTEQKEPDVGKPLIKDGKERNNSHE